MEYDIDLLTRARAGEGEAFRAVTEPHRRELLVHCYRMLGSLQDAEDVLQETMLAAWQGLPGFEERASLRTWLYRIATNRCLNARRAAQRRPPKEWDVPGFQPPDPTRLGEVSWLEPFPDDRLASTAGLPLGPEARYDQTESISLAFITALQLLPPRQVAVLVLRDVLGFHASEVAAMLDTTTESVSSALKRARAGLQRQRVAEESAPPAGSPAEEALVGRFVRAYQANDLDALVRLFTDDVFMAMPPLPMEYEGRDVVSHFLSLLFSRNWGYRLIPTRANGQPAFGLYVQAGDGMLRGTGLIVLTLAGTRISALTRFENSMLAWFGLPRSLPA
jgi:RNA polymerase sigma-70 factor (TIGR02960 family)